MKRVVGWIIFLATGGFMLYFTWLPIVIIAGGAGLAVLFFYGLWLAFGPSEP